MTTAAENHLIGRLPRAEQRRLLVRCETVDLTLSDVLCEAATATRHVYFPLRGFISLVRPVDAHFGLEVGMIGREGMLGSQLALGVSRSPLRSLVQGTGVARRVDATDFKAVLAASPVLQRVLLRYVQVLIDQLATSAACVRFHLIPQRLARWFLMSQDRSPGDSFSVTQEFLAYMLGVRRVGITTAAGALQRAGLIAYRRGEVTVLDRAGLEAAACPCYGDDLKSYADIL